MSNQVNEEDLAKDKRSKRQLIIGGASFLLGLWLMSVGTDADSASTTLGWGILMTAGGGGLFACGVISRWLGRPI
jgi:hypothetical protein